MILMIQVIFEFRLWRKNCIPVKTIELDLQKLSNSLLNSYFQMVVKSFYIVKYIFLKHYSLYLSYIFTYILTRLVAFCTSSLETHFKKNYKSFKHGSKQVAKYHLFLWYSMRTTNIEFPIILTFVIECCTLQWLLNVLEPHLTRQDLNRKHFIFIN